MKWICSFCGAINPSGAAQCHNCKLATDHDRIVAELEARAEALQKENFELQEITKQIESFVPGIRASEGLKRKALWGRLEELESELATARKVIEELREQRNKLVVAYRPLSAVQYSIEDLDAEIEAIERGEK